MIVPKNSVYPSQVPDLTSLYATGGEPSFPGLLTHVVNLAPPTQVGIPWGALLLGGVAFAGLVALTSDSEPKKRYCGACGRAGHNRTNCPYTGQRCHFSRSIPKSRRCQCCGQFRYGTQCHHSRGRADASARLDVCGDCHIECGHDGHYQNPARKPHVCRIMNRPSAWRV